MTVADQSSAVGPQVRRDPLSSDPYVQLLLSYLEDRTLLDAGPAAVDLMQNTLLRPYLDFFLRHDQSGFYARLFERKGLLRSGQVRPDVALTDLVQLRVHSDDLRGDGQQRRLIQDLVDRREDLRTFGSSGTSANPAGRVTIARSPFTLDLAHLTIGRHIEKMAGWPLAGATVCIQAAPEMRETMALPALSERAFADCGARVLYGSRLNDDSEQTSLWRRLEPDEKSLSSFFAAPGPKIWFAPPPALLGVIADDALLRRVTGSTEPNPRVNLGEQGVLMTGGGLKGNLGYRSMQQFLADVGPRVRSLAQGREIAAPVIDGLGLTESLCIFVNRAADPLDPDVEVKYPFPLTWVGLLESPRRLRLVTDPKPDEPYLLFYVNFACIDYLEAVIPGDVVARKPDVTSDRTDGLVYIRRAEELEGFQIREGCG